MSRRLLIPLVVAIVAVLLPSAAAQAQSGAHERASAARRYWQLDDRCRGSSDPSVSDAACRKRDRMLRRLGQRVTRRFHQEWREGDRATMRRLTARSQRHALAMFHGRAARAAADCSYDRSEPSWYCWMKGRDGAWVGARFEVVRHVRPGLPAWRLVGAAPDV